MSTPGTTVPAGWYPDPENGAQGRYWDGAAWTDVRHVPGQPYPAVPPPKAPPGTDGNTLWIWLIIFVPLIPSLLLLFVPWDRAFVFDPAAPTAAEGIGGMVDVFLSPFYWAAVLLGYVTYGLCVVFAYRDMRELAARGVPKPFHWAFAFIGGVVYTIGRSVIVKRRTGRGRAPLWAEIGVLLVSIAIVVWVEVVIFTSMSDMFRMMPAP